MTGAEENFISNEPVAIDGNNERTLPSETLGLFAADAPEWLSMDTVAAKGHVRRAPEQEQGQLNAAVFENLDGTYSMHYFGTDIKYVDEQGCERDKSTRLKPVTSGEYAFAVEDNNIRSLYPAQLSQETGVLLTDGAITIDIRPDSAANDAAREQAVPAADARSDKRTAKNGADRDIDRMLYQGVFGAGTALRYTPTFEGLKEDIILERPTEINRFSFLIRTGGLAVESNETEYQFVDGDGEIVARVGSIEVFDSGDSGRLREEEAEYRHVFEIE
ncbi:MAG: hypothetical protein FWE80_06890, partial [Oscillospiraceae bacterium]|nr:hypothetical protein [Oscillospiraceae bacterium]